MASFLLANSSNSLSDVVKVSKASPNHGVKSAPPSIQRLERPRLARTWWKSCGDAAPLINVRHQPPTSPAPGLWISAISVTTFASIRPRGHRHHQDEEGQNQAHIGLSSVVGLLIGHGLRYKVCYNITEAINGIPGPKPPPSPRMTIAITSHPLSG
jgi:hypothetical protein